MTRPARLQTLLAALLVATAPLLALAASAAPPPDAVPPGHPLSAPGNQTTAFVVAMAPAGGALAAWVESDNGTLSLWTSRLSPATGWSPAALRMTSSSSLGSLAAGLNDAGTATVFFVEYGSPHSVWFLRDGASGNGQPVLLHTTPQYFLGYWDAAFASDGSAFLFWTEYNGSSGMGFHWAAVVAPNGTVSGPDVMAGNRQATFERAVLPDPTGGGATALWCDRTGANANLTESHYAPGSNWSAPTVFAPSTSNGCSTMKAAIDGDRTITVLADAYYYGGVVSIRHMPGAPWGTPQLLVNTTSYPGYLDDLQIAASPDGHLVAGVRLNGEPFDTSDLFLAGYAPGAGWSAVQHPVASATLAPDFVLAASAAGGVAAVSHWTGSNYTLHAFEYSPLEGCGGWSAETDTGLFEVNPNILDMGLSDSGAGQLLYHTWDGAAYVLYAATVRATGLEDALTVVAPADGSHTSAGVAVVTGTTVPGSDVAVGGSFVAAGPDGTFSAAVPLVAGANTVDITSSLGGPYSGCSANASLTITFDDPLPPLMAQLDATRADLAGALARVVALEASGNATQAELAAALADLAAANDTIERMKGDFSRITNLTAAQDEELARVKVQFAWLDANVTAGQAQAASLSAQLADAQAHATLLEAQQNQTETTLRQATDDNAALAGQVAVLSIVAFAGLLAGIGGIGLAFVMARRGAGGEGGATDRMYNKRKLAEQELEDKPQKE